MLAAFKLDSRPQFSYHTLSHLIAQVGSKTIFIQQLYDQFPGPNFLITSYHALSLLITAYPLGWKENHFHLVTFKLDSRLQFSYHTLSHLITQVGSKTIFIWQLQNQFSGPNFLITSYHALPLLITPYHSLSPRLEEKPFAFGNF